MKLNKQNIKSYLGTENPNTRKSIRHELNKEGFEADLDAIVESDLLLHDFDALDKRFDRQFTRNTSFKWYFASILLILIIGSAGIYLNSRDTVNKPTQNSIDIHIKPINTKENLVGRIENNMSDSDSNSRIEIHEKKLTSLYEKNTSYKKNREENSNKKAEVENKNDVLDLSLNPLKITSIDEFSKIKRISSKGKEVILYDFILIDYREYRKKSNSKSTSLLITSGTPANQSLPNEVLEQEIKINEVSYFQFLTETIYDFKKQNMIKALQNFNLILDTFNDDANALFYGALCEMELKNFNKAILKLERVISNKFNNFDEEANWNLLKCFIQTGDYEKARNLQQVIIEGNGFYAKKAKTLMF